jgi:cytochrome c oxidase subunit 1
VKIFNWIFTMWGGSLQFTTAMKFAIALVALFTIGGISGVMHASPPADLQQTDTYFIVAHFHYVLFGGSMMGIFGGIYYYYPKITGRLLSEKLGNWHFWLMFVGMNLTFFPMHFSGLYGMPRRIYTYDAGQGWEVFNAMSTWGTYIIAVVNWSDPPHIVKIQLKIFTPVGMAMSIVVTPNTVSAIGPMPTANMWCAHTPNPRNAMRIVA